MLANKTQLNYYPEEVYKEPMQKDLKKKKKKKKKRSNAIIKILILFSGLIAMGICLFILVRYANITKTRMELTQIEMQKIELENIKIDLLAELDGIKSSPSIIDHAVNKLGMNYPEKDQIVYVSLIDKDLTVDIVDENSGKSIDKIFSLISSLF